MKKALILLNTLLIGFTASVWTGTGESSDPVLTDREIPAEIANACALTQTDQGRDCALSSTVRRWVAKTPRGDLFLVSHDRCTGAECRAWLVEKTESGSQALLGFEARYRLHEVRNGYPVVESYAALSDREGSYHRYEWNGSVYARTQSRVVFSVDGVECGTREECRIAAGEAINQKQIDRAVRIWENVAGVSWI